VKEVDGAVDDEREKSAKAATKEGTVDVEQLKKCVETLIAKSEQVLAENATLAKRVDGQEQALAQFRSGVQAPNSVNPERPPVKKSENVEWPMNMNGRRSSRMAKGGKTAGEDDSFLDE
jgi:hypothetical protein